MATLEDLGVSAAINLLSTFVFLLAFAFLKVQPMNDRVYFAKWYLKGVRKEEAPNGERSLLKQIVNLDLRAYLRFLSWMKEALRMPEMELIEHAGLDSAVYLRVYLLGLKIFIPLMLLGFFVLVPINATDQNLKITSSKILSTDIDKLSLSNVKNDSNRLWVHLSMTYVFTAWTCFMLYIEYKTVSAMRFRFLDTDRRRPDQFTVLVQQIPVDPDEPLSLHIDHFFRVNHPNYYLGHQVVYNANYLANLVRQREHLQNWLDYYQLKHARHPEIRPMKKVKCLGLVGKKIDSIDYYTGKIAQVTEMIEAERQRVLSDNQAKMPVAFVYFKNRWGAAVCAQTRQSRNAFTWLTDVPPEPRDVYWQNLAIPYIQLNARKLLVTGAVFLLVFFYIIPVTFVQSLANLEGIEKELKFLKPIIKIPFVRSFLQGFLPGLVLKLFLLVLPTILMIMSKIEGFISLSKLELVTAAKYYYFIVINVFFTSVIAGAAFQQLRTLLHESPSGIVKLLGNNIPIKATFFITYIMVDGWSAVAGDMLRLKHLFLYHIKNLFLVKTEKDREKAMSPGTAGFDAAFPQVQLYFLLGLIYAILTPFILPFIVVYFAFSYVVYRHQVINVYEAEYESAAAFWPHIHDRIIVSMIIEQLTLIGVFSTKMTGYFVPLLAVLLVLTILFHLYCKRRFEAAFHNKYPLEDAMQKDILDTATVWNTESYLEKAYLHPIFKDETDSLDTEAPLA